MDSTTRKPGANLTGSGTGSGYGASVRRRPPAPPPGPIARVGAGGARASSPAYLPASPTVPTRFGMPNLRRNVCPHFYITGARGAIPIQAPHLLKALMRQEINVSRCQVRGGVHLESGYVSDICLSARFNQCVFYEDDLSDR
ncbi:hypothetical protein BH20CHL6_BH20CHL6_14550 [soil metagenome]